MNDTVLVLSVVSAISAGTPILFAALGEIMTERSGVMNLGIDGMMLMGAVTGFWVGVETESAVLALLAGGLAGVLGLVFVLGLHDALVLPLPEIPEVGRHLVTPGLAAPAAGSVGSPPPPA